MIPCVLAVLPDNYGQLVWSGLGIYRLKYLNLSAATHSIPCLHNKCLALPSKLLYSLSIKKRFQSSRPHHFKTIWRKSASKRLNYLGLVFSSHLDIRPCVYKSVYNFVYKRIYAHLDLRNRLCMAVIRFYQSASRRVLGPRHVPRAEGSCQWFLCVAQDRFVPASKA